MGFLANLNWRYATKKYDTSRKVPQETLQAILEAIRMAPTSNGYQPYDVMVVSDPGIRARLRAAAFDQPQITEASHVLVFAAWDTLNEGNLGKVFDNFAAVRGASESLAERRASAIAGLGAKPSEEHNRFAVQQAFIGLGFGLAAAAELKVDSSPMGGFKPAEFDEILGLKSLGLRSCVILCLGYRATEGDWLVNLKKVRRPAADFFHFV